MPAPTDTEYAALVDPFLGNGASDLPPTEGLAARWFWPKAQTGNTHPGACGPFGMVSVGAYSGAYVTGYGLHAPSYDGQPERLFDDYTAIGFTHFQQSGTGAIGSYYNYLRVTPFVGSFDQVGERWTLVGEQASPGYYATELAGSGIRAELTVSARAAVHRYAFPQGADATLAIDISAGGLILETMRTIPTQAGFELVSDRALEGRVVVEGIPLYFYLETDSAARSWGTWSGRTPDPSEKLSYRTAIAPETYRPFGAFFTFGAAKARQVEIKVGFSVSSFEQARENVRALDGQDFDAVAAATHQCWERALSCIRVAGGTAAQRSIFYSLLYFSLLKPSDFGTPYWDGDGPFYFDFATMWDMYKTQLPLVLTLFPERGSDVANALLNLADHFGVFPNGFVMSRDIHAFDGQASCLAHVTLSDAYGRGLGGIDWKRAVHLMATAFKTRRPAEFVREGKVLPYTHTLDLAYAAFLTTRIARAEGEDAIAEKLAPLAANWRNVYDPGTGLLSEDSPYYEGTLWNYSFRLFHDVGGRIGLFESEEAFVDVLDRFFGFGQPPCEQVVRRPYEGAMERGFALGRWEGLNNEPDMEAPYIYIYAGRPDRTAKIVRTAMRSQFHTGRGGLPGNDDSGGTSSWFVWSAIGLFPVAGQDIFLIGSPLFSKVTLALAAATFRIEARNNSDEAVYVQSATLNGQPLDRAYLRYAEIAAGGTLVLEMGINPSEWGREDRPPSYG
ncbi:MAG: GH92 family glycosyl hydrolase [Anaerolineae bacterium]|nr:GH92 family glycosyl hydrolase [Anaerolineae bacterium]